MSAPPTIRRRSLFGAPYKEAAKRSVADYPSMEPPRFFRLGKDGQHGQRSLHVLFWNVLSPDCADQDPERGFPLVSKETLDTDKRKSLIVEYIEKADPDVVVLNESWPDLVCALEGTYKKYEHPKSKDAVLWRISRLRLISAHVCLYRDMQTQRILATDLAFQPDAAIDKEYRLLVATTHFKAGREARYVRHDMATQLINFLKPHIPNYDYAILCTDLNTSEKSDTYQHILRAGNAIDVYNTTLCPTSDPQKPEAGYKDTTFKYRREDGVLVEEARCSDYMFLLTDTQRSLETSALGIIDDIRAVYAEKGLPDPKMPSDHIPLHAIFNCLT